MIFFDPNYKHDDVMTDVRWLLFLVSATLLQVGLIKSWFDLLPGVPFVLGAVLCFIVAFMSNFWTRFILLLFGSIALGTDFVYRCNVFSILFLIVGVYHLICMLKFRQRGVRDANAENSP